MSSESNSLRRYRYSYRVERWHPHSKIVCLVGAGKRVLDIGCASGYLAEKFKYNGCFVAGVEVNPEEAEEAKAYCDMLINADVEQLAESTFADESFDVIVYADILEHLKRPEVALRCQRKWLSRDGFVIVSLPNVAFIGIRLRLLFGQFDYTHFGILDRTHLRFYTLKTARSLLREGGYHITQVEPTGRLSSLWPFRMFPHLCASGFVFKAVPLAGEGGGLQDVTPFVIGEDIP